MLAIFLVWMLLFIAFGTFTILETKSLKNATEDIYEHNAKLSEILSQIHVDILKIQRIMRDIILSQDILEFQSKINEINQLEKNIHGGLDALRGQAKEEEEPELKTEIREIMGKWKGSLNEIIELVLNQQFQEASLAATENNSYVEELEKKIDALRIYEVNRSNKMIQQIDGIERSHILLMLVVMILLPLMFIILSCIVMKSILRSIATLKEIMYKSTHLEDMQEYPLEGKNEITDMAYHYNLLIKKLKEEFWLKDSQNQLSEELQGDLSLKEFTQKTINYLARKTGSGKGAFYLYDHENKLLYLDATFAMTEEERLSKQQYPIGCGIVGQVALEKKPILLKNIQRNHHVIQTGTLVETPLNTYTFPLIYEEQLYGVMELASFQSFTELQQKLISEVSPRISINLYTAIQNNKIKELLKATKTAQEKAQEAARKLQVANQELEEKNFLLHQQSSVLQQNNGQLEEQQQLLEEKSRELQQSYLELEEKQRQLEEQSRLLSMQNEDLVKSREELTKRTKELEKSSRYKTEFLANVSHELRTPLNSIILLSKLILNNTGGKYQEEDLEKIKVIYRSGKELLRLINDILDLSKIEAGRFDLDIVKFTSEELMRELQEMFEEIANEKKIDFIIKDLVKEELRGDKNKISQILRNFLSNAFKFTEKGKVILEIARDEKKEDSILFSVKDTGIGISSDKQSIIFDEFKQVDGSISRKYGGTGLGLSIGKKYAEFMGGEIFVTSEVGVGSTFVLQLQNLSTKVRHEEIQHQGLYVDIIKTGLSQISSSADKDSYDKEDKTISRKIPKELLIVENHDSLKEVLDKEMSKDNISITTAHTEAKAIQELSKGVYDAILLDFHLQEGNTLNICEYVKEHKIEIPVIIYTEGLLSKEEGDVLDRYSENIVIKTVGSKDALLDEVALYFQGVEGNNLEDYYGFNGLDETGSFALQGKRILIVDDDPRNLFVLATVLEDHGATIYDAENGEVALERLKELIPDLILMDIMMPVMDGYETIKAIRQDEGLKDIPIIALTANALKEDRIQCINIGANDYITKPVDYDTLLHLVKTWTMKD